LMDMNRRSVLAGLVAVIAGVATGTEAMPITKSMLRDPELGRYAKVVVLQREAYALNDRMKEIGRFFIGPKIRQNPEWQENQDKLNLKFDELLGYMLEQFDGELTEEIGYMYDDVLHRRLQIDVMTIEGLKAILDTFIPVAVTRHAFIIERCAFQTHKMPNFGMFAAKYGQRLLNTGGRHPKQIKAMYPEWYAKNMAGNYREETWA
jgi:hypothetical protein